jgi:hypothetical protein
MSVCVGVSVNEPRTSNDGGQGSPPSCAVSGIVLIGSEIVVDVLGLAPVKFHVIGMRDLLYRQAPSQPSVKKNRKDKLEIYPRRPVGRGSLPVKFT